MHISSMANQKIKDMVRLQKSAAFRRESGIFMCEGPVLLEEALSSGLEPREVYATEKLLHTLPQGLTCPIHTVSPEVMGKICGTVTPQGLAFTLDMPEAAAPARGPVVALDNVRDPGNVGTIIRTADALGVAVVLLGDCADIYSPKVVRAAMGSLFRLRPLKLGYAELKELCNRLNMPIYAAALGAGSVPASEAELGGACVIIGNEAAGVSENSLDISEKSVIIPIHRAESLNAAVAAAILMWEAVR